MKTLIIFFMMCGVAFGAVNEKYSYKNFTHQSFKHLPAKEFNNSTIIGSCFYQEGEPDQDIFPDGLVNVVFEKNNLDNVLIKAGMVVDNSNSIKKIKVQNDGEDWIVEKNLDKWEAKEPLNKVKFDAFGVSKLPKDIPIVKQEITIIEQRKKEIMDGVKSKEKRAKKDLIDEETLTVINSHK